MAVASRSVSFVSITLSALCLVDGLESTSYPCCAEKSTDFRDSHRLRQCSTSKPCFVQVGVGRCPSFPLIVPPTPAQLFFDSGVKVTDLEDSSDFPPQYQFTVTGKVKKKPKDRPKLGHRLVLNGKEVSLFKYLGEVLAFAAICPHMGGPLDEGDIEDIDGTWCVSCPWHGFSFELKKGECVAPKVRRTPHVHGPFLVFDIQTSNLLLPLVVTIQGDLKIETYPTKTDPEGFIHVGFPSVSKAVFESDDF